MTKKSSIEGQKALIGVLLIFVWTSERGNHIVARVKMGSVVARR